MSNAKMSQLNTLLVCRKNGAQAYFLVWFRKYNKIVRFNAEQIKQKLSDGIKSVSPEEGEVWDWTELVTSRTSTAS